MAGVVNSGSGVEIDCAAIEQADITFVQTIVSAQRSFAARSLSFTLLAVTEGVRSAFERAGVDEGAIIDQASVRIETDDTLETLATKLHAAEHRLLVAVVRRFSEQTIND